MNNSLLKLLLLVLLCGNSILTAQKQEAPILAAQEFEYNPNQTPHPEWRTSVNPANNSNTSGPVTFLWPVAPKNSPAENIDWTFHFVLSKNKSLSNPILEKKGLEWAYVNTHTALPKGDYYWQYETFKAGKTQGKSKIFHFSQTQTTLGFVTSSVADFIKGIPTEHPRLLSNSASKKHIDNYSNTHSKEVDKKLKKADFYFGIKLPSKQYGGQFFKNGKRVLQNKKFPDWHPKSKPTGRVYKDAIDALAMAYILSGDKKYAKEGVRWAINVANFPLKDVLTPDGANGGFPQDDFDIAVLMPTLAKAFDTFYNEMNSSQMALIKKSLNARVEGFYQYFRNRLEARVMDNHAWQHTFLNYLESAIALAGEHKDATKFLTYAYGVWVARFPVQSITDGGWTNGKYVGVNFHTWTAVPLYIRDYTGTDYYQHPFFKNQIEWLMARFPPKSWADGFGGDGYEDEKKLKNGTIHWLHILNAEFKDPRINWYLKKWGKSSENHEVVWERMIRGLKSDHSAKPKKINATNFLFKDTGVMNSVVNWDKPDTYIAFRSAPWGNFGHNLPNSNAINILHNGTGLIFPTGYRHGGKKHAYEWYRNSRAYNTLTVNGKGQPVSSHAWGQITQYLDGNDVVFVQGDASNAYTGEPSPQWYDRFTEAGVDWYKYAEAKSLKCFKRNVLFIKPGIVVIYDEVAATEKADFNFNFHSPSKINKKSNTIHIQNKTSRAKGYFYGNDLDLSVVDTSFVKPFNVDGRFANGKTAVYKDIGSHLSIKTKGSKQYLLSVFDIDFASKELRKINYKGKGEVIIDGIKIEANIDPKLPAQLKVQLNDNRVFQLSNNKAELK